MSPASFLHVVGTEIGSTVQVKVCATTSLSSFCCASCKRLMLLKSHFFSGLQLSCKAKPQFPLFGILKKNYLTEGLFRTSIKTPTAAHTGPRHLVRMTNILSCSKEEVSCKSKESVSHSTEWSILVFEVSDNRAWCDCNFTDSDSSHSFIIYWRISKCTLVQHFDLRKSFMPLYLLFFHCMDSSHSTSTHSLQTQASISLWCNTGHLLGDLISGLKLTPYHKEETVEKMKCHSRIIVVHNYWSNLFRCNCVEQWILHYSSCS